MEISRASRMAVFNVIKEGLTDIFPRPFEVDLLSGNKIFAEEVVKQLEIRLKSCLESRDLSALRVHPLQHVLLPKKEAFDFRRAALMQPMDTVTYLALVLTIADELEKHRPHHSKKIVFSYRFKPKGGFIFDARYNFTAFERHVLDVLNRPRTKVLVKCDIASFYDRLNLHRLESTLLGLSIDKKIVSSINSLLLFWANRDSYGLPIGGNASRILAEAALISVDDYLISHNIKFCRFVDDYRFFAPDIESAHAWLTIFVERLFLEGLSINPLKTFLEDVSERRAGKNSLANANNSLCWNKNGEKKPVKIIVGYSGSIPTKFRELSEKEVNDLNKENALEILRRLKKQVVIDPDEVRKFLKIVVAQSKYEKLKNLPKILERFPQFTPLAVDLLIKKSNEVPDLVRAEIRKYFCDKCISDESKPEYILIAIIRLLGSAGYESKNQLLEMFRGLRRSVGSYVGRSIIDSLFNWSTRNDALEIRQYFNKVDSWEKRAIIRLVNKAIPEDEKRPWLKNVKIHSADDVFAIESFDPKKKVKKRKNKT